MSKPTRLGAWTEKEELEYFIRRYQNAIVVIQRSLGPKDEVGYKQVEILRYARKIIPLKRRLLELTGKCSPSSPKWPR